MNPDNQTPADLEKSGKIEEAEKWLWDDFNRARDIETHSINEFEKLLWLTNSGAATITIGYLTTSSSPSLILFFGSCMFVTAVVALLIMKFVGETNATRDRARRQRVSELFFSENRPMSTFKQIRDSNFKALVKAYKWLKTSAAILFMVGCILTLSSVYPRAANVEDVNKPQDVSTSKSEIRVK